MKAWFAALLAFNSFSLSWWRSGVLSVGCDFSDLGSA